MPRGLAVEGPICARRRRCGRTSFGDAPARLVGDLTDVVRSDVEVVVVVTPPSSHVESRGSLSSTASTSSSRSRSPRAEATPRARRAGLEATACSCAAPFVSSRRRSARSGRRYAAAQSGACTARGLYGNAGSPWAAWYHHARVGPLAEAGIYNLKSLTALLGPAVEVLAAEAVAVPRREAGGTGHRLAGSRRLARRPSPRLGRTLVGRLEPGDTAVSASGARALRRRGTANLLGDDWDPRGYEIWRNATGSWEECEPIDGTWLWADGLRECVTAVREERPPLRELEHDLHLLDVVAAARDAVTERRAVEVGSRFPSWTSRTSPERPGASDHTRPLDEQQT